MAVKQRKREHELERMDARFLGRGDEPDELQVVSARGSRVEDAKGRSYIDFQMGWCVGNLGWNHPDIVARLHQFNGPVYVNPSALYAPWVELGRLLAELTPAGLTRSYRATGGTEAVEIALQLAMKATGRHKLVSLEGAYHGASIATRSIGDPKSVGHPYPNCKHLAPPFDAKAADRLETLLKHRDVAAFIMEPIVMNLGVEIPEPGLMTAAAELCAKYGTLLVMDEVATGFGRTGKMFASSHYGLEPDILCMAKAITGGHAPLGATITTEEVADKAELDYYSTYGWHPIATEAAIATCGYFIRHEAELFANAAARSLQFADRLAAMPWEREIELRIRGLAIGVDLGDAEYAAKLVDKARTAGVLIAAEDATLLMFPALTLDVQTASEGLGLIEQVL